MTLAQVPFRALSGIPGWVMPVATRAALAAADPDVTPLCYLYEAGREGLFKFSSGDFAARITAQNGTDGIYVEHDTVASTTGAWERVDHKYGWRTDWFGWIEDGGGGSGVNTDGPAKGLFDLGNIVKPQLIEISEGIYSFDTALPDISWQVEIAGTRAQQSTILNKRYTAGNSRGLLAFNDFGFHLHDFTIRATAGSGGRGISAILTNNSPAAGRSFMERLSISMGNFANGSIAIDGSANTSVGGPSYRGLWINDCEFFGGATDSVNLRSVHHLFMSSIFIADTGGSVSAGTLIINGDAAAYNDDVHIHGIIAGNTSMTRLSRSTFHSPRYGNITNDSTCSGITWTGANVTGTHQTNWTGSAYLG